MGAAKEAAQWPAIDRAIAELARRARILPALHPRNAAGERARLEDELVRGRVPVPRWDALERLDARGLFVAIDRAREAVARHLPPELGALYAARLDELELDAALLEALGDPRRVRPLVARRYGTGARVVEGHAVRDVARALLARLPPEDEARTVAAEELAAMMRRTARAVGLSPTVRVEPRLSAGAAAGDHTIFVQDRAFGPIEARRLVAHEVLGHAVASHRALGERLRLFEIGTAGSFADQEGLAITLEEQAGALDPARLRVLAARVVATDRMHDGAAFGETARALVEVWGLTPRVSIAIAERTYRGGGVARDAAYLEGFLRVRAAVARREATIDALRAGRVSVAALPALRWAADHGWCAPPEVAPSHTVSEALAAGGCPPGLPEAARAQTAALLPS
jgi:uncharacterized protein (TIGR02421 family)